MRRQSGYEDDWIRALNEAGNLANTLSQTKARGLQTQITEQEMADKKRKEAIANTMTTGLSRGETPGNLSKVSSVPGAGPGWAKDFNSVNAGLEPDDRDYVLEDGFTRSSDAVGSAEVMSGLNDALEMRAKTFKQAEDAKYQEMKNLFASQPIDQLLSSEEVRTGNFGKYGANAAAASRAIASVLSDFSKLPEEQAKINEGRKKLIAQKYSEFVANTGIARELLNRGDRVGAAQKMADVVNNSNLAHKARAREDGSLEVYITENGSDKPGEIVSLEDMSKRLDSIKMNEFAEITWAAAEDAKRFNEKSAAAPETYIHPKTGEIITAHAHFDPWSGKNSWFIARNGVQAEEKDLARVLAAGFVPYKRELYQTPEEKAKAALDVNNERKRGLLIDAQIKATKARANGGGAAGGKKVTTNMLKYLGKEFNKNVVSRMAGVGATIIEDDMGILRSTGPLDERQKLNIESIGSKNGLVAVTYPNEEGGYDFHGFVSMADMGADSSSESGQGSYVNDNLKALRSGETPADASKNKWIRPLTKEEIETQPSFRKGLGTISKVLKKPFEQDPEKAKRTKTAIDSHRKKTAENRAKYKKMVEESQSKSRGLAR